ncbi:dTMP kinase [Saccharopolyspora lacisalsi]|uniref:Thymidylate kinase n=1 Tax=Halosaccharopolyspora lacisalsi TaxID=1000566 RepID=A0A839DZX8_9PSEU|nr:dTMP kinase [Halosaccharopolyspora lacisalsi]MBA8825047.1 dTMP kinase [Halosaccharopolyspora lacisalsi]
MPEAAARDGKTRVVTVGRLIAIEGLDGAGKRTLVDGLAAELDRRGHSVARAAFPRYGADVHADLVAEALRADHGDLAESVHGMAVLYALDRRSATDALRADLRVHDVVLVDRYVASNAAYGAARLHQGADGDFVAWVRELEIERFALPRPDLQILLRVPTEVAADRAESRERAEVERRRDRFETDSPLQQRCAEVYTELAETAWWSPWHVVDGVERVDFGAVVDKSLAQPTSG